MPLGRFGPHCPGGPVVGPLAQRDIELEPLFVVTTTWGEWRRRHPRTKVLSIDTGYERDYREGAAYRDYFSTDELMFTVPELDTRLKNKDEVLALRFPEVPMQQLAIAVEFLAGRTVYHDSLGAVDFIVLTDQSGASRVYETRGPAVFPLGRSRRSPGRIRRVLDADRSGPHQPQSDIPTAATVAPCVLVRMVCTVS